MLLLDVFKYIFSFSTYFTKDEVYKFFYHSAFFLMITADKKWKFQIQYLK